MALSTGLRFRPSLDFALCRCCASLWFRRRAHASHLIVISTVDLANGQGHGLGLAHGLESGSIVSQKALCAWRKFIEATELGHHKPSGKIRLGLRVSFLSDTGVRAGGHGGRLVGPLKLTGVHGYRWTVSRLTSAVLSSACLFGVAAEAAKPV
jgi:hypothetical protein